MAEASVTNPIPASLYTTGYAQNGGIVNGQSYYNYVLPLGQAYGGPLFFTQYTYMALDPRKLSDKYANYWQFNVNQSLINWTYCQTDPLNFVGYNTNCWGLTASDNPWGYGAQSPTNDNGVITPTAAVSAIPYTPQQSMDAIRFITTCWEINCGDLTDFMMHLITVNWWASSLI